MEADFAAEDVLYANVVYIPMFESPFFLHVDVRRDAGIQRLFMPLVSATMEAAKFEARAELIGLRLKDVDLEFPSE